jgi:imidazolonepropionase-like amidohydrolase
MTRLLITNASLLEPASGERIEGAWLEAADGLIAAIGTGRPPVVPGDVRVIDAGARTVLPGLIDAHVHVLLTTLDTGDAATWTPGYAAIRALRAAEAMLRRGFTTVRDVGGADHGLARAIADGLVPGPRLIHGGRALTQTGGHGDLRPRGDDSMPCCQAKPSFARIADGADAVRHAARDEFRKGAAHLKLLLSGGVASPNDEIGAVQYSDGEIQAAVDEAANHGRYVTAHAYHPRAINRALRAGVRCIEHGNLLDGESLRLLAEHDAYLVPTLVTYAQLAAAGEASGMGEESLRKLAEVGEAALSALESADRAGVNIVFGTDLLGPMQAAQTQEFLLRAQVQSPLSIIRSATVTAARLLGMAGKLGTVTPGAIADLLVVDGDPAADVTVLAEPEGNLRHVIRAGSIQNVGRGL